VTARLLDIAAAVAVMSMAMAGCASTSPTNAAGRDGGGAAAARSVRPSAAAPSAAGPVRAGAGPGGAGGASLSRPPASVMVDNALSMLGQPYRYGGAAPGGFDCSGLVAFAAAGAGIRVPRTALEQLRAGMPVARDDLRAGDLVFMHLAHKQLHVGIAISNERFVHAPATGGHVRIDSLAAPPYVYGFTAARRFAAVR